VAQRAWYGEGHPLGASPLGDEAALAATTRDDLLGFWRSRYRPDRAALVVADDVGAEELRTLAERLFGDWRPDAPAAAAPERLAPPRPTAARLVLVDRPGTPQTALALVGPGPRAADPQRGATEVMNAALGGLFTSRINQRLREVKGYTYGMFSGYTEGRDDGLFAVRGSVRTPVTGAALGDLYKELDAIRARPLGAEELARARNARLRSLPGEFDTNRAVADAYADAWAAGLPPDHVVRLPSRYAAVTAASAFAAARAHVEPGRILTVAVGDRSQIGAQLDQLGRGPVELRDADGKPLPAPGPGAASGAAPAAAPASAPTD
jgi:zinc protease